MKNGERGNDPPEIVNADTYGDVGEFIEFSVAESDYLSSILRIRASDVQAIKRMDGPRQ